MKLEFLQPISELKPYIIKIWLFENEGGLMNHGALIAPNAKPKIIIPYKNAITTTDNKKTAVCREGDIYLIGIRDVPVTLGTPEGASSSIGIEFTTDGAYQFLNLPMFQLTNNLFSFSDLFEKEGRIIIQRIIDESNPLQKSKIIQEFLLHQLQKVKRNNHVVNYSVNFITSMKGLTTIKELEHKTGYTKRYLDLLFKNYLGISPKTYATIVRFQHYYKYLKDNQKTISSDISIYDRYFDQSHFIKEFRRYTGFTPGQLAKFNNDFGKNF